MEDYKIERYNDNDTAQNFEEEQAYLRAKKRVEKIQGFYVHLVVYIVVNVLLIVTAKSRIHFEFWSFGTFSTAIFWGIGLFFHFLGVFGGNLIFGKNWEERQIKKYMDEDKKHWE